MLKIELQDVPTGTRVRQAYDRIYGGEHPIRLTDGFYRWVFGLLDARAGDCFLDVACGQGHVVREAIRAGLCGHGVDISAAAIRAARRIAPTGVFTVSDGESVPYPRGTFDYVASIGSLEHYQSPENGMQEIARVLKPGGKACLHLPNLFGLFWNVLWVWKTGDVCVDDQPIQRYGTRRTWERMLDANGLSVLEVRKHIRLPPRSLYDVLWYARHPRSLIYLALTPMVPVNLGNSLVYLCTTSRSAIAGQRCLNQDSPV